jgi:hypothetical protein
MFEEDVTQFRMNLFRIMFFINYALDSIQRMLWPRLTAYLYLPLMHDSPTGLYIYEL